MRMIYATTICLSVIFLCSCSTAPKVSSPPPTKAERKVTTSSTTVKENLLPSSSSKNALSKRRRLLQTIKEIKSGFGILVVSVFPGSAAARARLKAGDIIVSMDNIKLSDMKSFLVLLKKAKAGKHKILIQRSGNKRRKTRFKKGVSFYPLIVNLPPIGTSPRLGVQISNLDTAVASQKPPAVNLVLKEATRRVDHTPSSSLSQRLEEINVLKSAMIDEETGRVVFIGTYDPTYASGPISYRNLLADALHDPYPSFSLDIKTGQASAQKIKQALDAEIYRISNDEKYGIKWMKNTLMSVLNSKDPIPEKLIFEHRMRQKMGIEPDEFQTYLNWNVKSKTTYSQYKKIGSFLGKLFTSLGIEERFGRAFIVFAKAQMEVRTDTTNYSTTLELCNLLHINEELAQIRSDFNKKRIDDETAGRRLYSLYYRTLLKGLGVSPSKVDVMANRYRNGVTWDEDLAYALEERYEFLAKEALRLHVFKSFVLSQDFLHIMYPNLPYAYSGVLLYGRSPDSPLMRVMLDADYAFKYITSLNPDTLFIPGHQSSLEFLTSEEERLCIPLPDEGGLRHWIKPGVVKMNSYQDKSGVRFISAKIGIGTEPLYPNSGLNDFTQSLDSYARGLTQRYDTYAKLYPSLHIMRETEKIIAFARWIRRNNITVEIGEFEPVKNPVPEKVRGFVSVVFINKATGDMDDLFIDIDGGVVFGQNEGEEWIQEEPNAAVTNDVIHQLAASTALAEQAAGAALDGDLDTARDLAEKSVRAMTGVIDTTQLPRIIDLPEPVPSDTTSVGTRSVISQEAILAVDRNLQSTISAHKQIAKAESLRKTSPEQYQTAISSAKKLEQHSQDNLRHLQELLSHYRNNPVYPQKLIVDLQALDPSKAAVVKFLLKKQPVLPQEAPLIETAIPEREKLLYELSALESELSMTRSILMRLIHNVQSNNVLFKEWQDEAAGAVNRAENRAQDLIQETLSEGFFSLLKWKFKEIPAKVKKIDKFEEIITIKDFSNWSQIDLNNWEEIGKALVSATQELPLGPEFQAVIKSTQNIIDSSYDITAWFVSWRRIQQLEKNSDAYLIAVQKISKHMKKIVVRIQYVKTQLQNYNP